MARCELRRTAAGVMAGAVLLTLAYAAGAAPPASRDSVRDGSRDSARDGSRDSARDGSRDSARDGSRHGGRDATYRMSFVIPPHGALRHCTIRSNAPRPGVSLRGCRFDRVDVGKIGIEEIEGD